MLEQERVLSVPTAFRATGGTISRSGRILLWSSVAPYVLTESSNDSLVTVGNGILDGPLAAEIADNGDVWVLDSAMHAVVRFGRANGSDSIVPIKWPGLAIDAVETGDGWDILAATRSGALIVVHIDTAGREVDQYSVPAALGAVLPGAPVSTMWRLSKATAGVMVIHVRPPITFAVVGSGAPARVARLWTAISDSGTTFNLRMPTWVASPVFSVGAEDLVSVADVESDLRLLIRLDSLGRVVHVTPLRVAVGLLRRPQNVGRSRCFAKPIKRRSSFTGTDGHRLKGTRGRVNPAERVEIQLGHSRRPV